ncbi:MAG: serine/threonine protein kinase [Leptolyngbya sp. SIO4C5]|nr:serine/threonine protein kinase [Leptolyngbya sp. SIO4C5]
MSYCINPQCSQRHNADQASHCQACQTPLLIQERYRLLQPLRELDSWNPTEVFIVDDRGSHKVLKLLKNPRLQPLFQREFMALQQLSHKGIPQVEPDGYFSLPLKPNFALYGLVMEKIEGTTIEQWVNQNGPVSQAQVLNWLHQLLDILGLLHQKGLFHRDLKPTNVMRRVNGQLALIDFGTIRQITNTYLAKIGGQREVTSIVSPGYTPLEQINGKAVPQSDFYALGRSLVFCLTGQSPLAFKESSLNGKLLWQQQVQIAPWLAELIDQLMAPFPGQRPLNTQAILQRLQSPPPESKPTFPLQQVGQALAIANLSLLVVQLAVGWYWWRSHQSQSSSRRSSSALVSRSTAAIPTENCLRLSRRLESSPPDSAPPFCANPHYFAGSRADVGSGDSQTDSGKPEPA